VARGQDGGEGCGKGRGLQRDVSEGNLGEGKDDGEHEDVARRRAIG